MYLVRALYNLHNCNCLDVMCARGRPYMLGHLTAPVAALLSPLMCVAISGLQLKVDVTSHNSEYLLKAYCLGMVNMKSGILTPKGLHFLCLSPGDLKNG